MILGRNLVLAVSFVAAASAALASQTKAPDLTGTWTGTFTSTTSTGEPDEDPAHLVLKQTGSELTGTGGPSPERQMPITNGKVTTAKGVTGVTFEVTEGGSVTIKFDLKLVDGRLKGNAVAEMEGRQRTAVLDVGRSK
jgi:hypothetical protein